MASTDAVISLAGVLLAFLNLSGLDRKIERKLASFELLLRRLIFEQRYGDDRRIVARRVVAALTRLNVSLGIGIVAALGVAALPFILFGAATFVVFAVGSIVGIASAVCLMVLVLIGVVFTVVTLGFGFGALLIVIMLVATFIEGCKEVGLWVRSGVQDWWAILWVNYFEGAILPFFIENGRVLIVSFTSAVSIELLVVALLFVAERAILVFPWSGLIPIQFTMCCLGRLPGKSLGAIGFILAVVPLVAALVRR